MYCFNKNDKRRCCKRRYRFFSVPFYHGTIFLRDIEGEKAEIGYELAQSYWRQGIMSEVLNEVIRIGFEELCLVRL